MIETQSGALYTGITTDVQRRFEQHSSGKGARFFRTSKPVRIVHVEPGLDRSTALSREAAIKQLTVHEKRRLIRCKKKRF
ncbi:MAG TPA: GIY-YIG nuclease family protein [Leptospiraceae bacterium]|jgi:putative endonuclease|nr:GIY-YIG nuclease family protein [Leptospirales bacterium]HMU84630.1 GIY-YIG nuclease family protein [Leptospiraceae bacterium]HMX56602.1 GIY-YIG nuclease family protein [Leptospiraceae bacterium]HMY45970.1 GIY-YIG nuclease family protein [Leptospiraceae bacterium]HNE25312.1 GIY-YIG nuclease family protein [Leptospiraceae bacterium]